MFPECPEHFVDTPGTLGTLSGHFKFWTLRETLPRTPPFARTLSARVSGRFLGTLGPFECEKHLTLVAGLQCKDCVSSTGCELAEDARSRVQQHASLGVQSRK